MNEYRIDKALILVFPTVSSEMWVSCGQFVLNRLSSKAVLQYQDDRALYQYLSPLLRNNYIRDFMTRGGNVQ